MAVFRHSIEAFINPLFLCLLFNILALLFLVISNTRRKASIALALAISLILISATGWLPAQLTHKLENVYPLIEKADPQLRWVVVLSGGQANREQLPANAILYSASIKRLIEGIRLFRQMPKAQLVLSGGGYGFEIAEAKHLQQLAAWFAIPKERILLESASINTAEQAIALKPILREEPFYLVTSAIHMPRAMALFQKEGMHPIAAPTDFTFYWDDERWQKTLLPNAHNMMYTSIVLHELLGRLWGRWFH